MGETLPLTGWKQIGYTCGEGDCGRIHETPATDDAYSVAVYIADPQPVQPSEQAVKDSQTMLWRNRYQELRLLLDRRPAMNAGLVEAYQKWSGECYALDVYDAMDGAAL